MVTQQSTAMILGSREEITAYATRIGYMIKGGSKLNDSERMALAQVALVTGLNPFIGEVWYIPGSGPMVGIAGARRLDNERVESKGGYTWETYDSVPPEEAGASPQEIPNIAAAFKVTIHDSTATAQYQKMFADTLKMLREAVTQDPFAEAKEVCGNRPEWVGYGFSLRGESSRMGKVQLARKRAHADALKKRIVIPFGGTVADTDAAPGYDVDAEAIDMEYPEKKSELQNLSELGFDSEPPTPQNGESKTPVPHPDHTKNVDALSADVVNGVLNEKLFDKTEAATSVLSRFVPKKAPLKAFLEKARLYREWKDKLGEGAANTDKAIAAANTGEKP